MQSRASKRSKSQLAQTRPGASTLQAPQAQGRTVCILVVGRSGSGKSYFINNVCSDPDRCGTCHLDQGTLDVKSHRTPILPSGRRFKLIDTPGFHNINLSDTEVFCKIGEYLFDQKMAGKYITGIIYVHPARDDIQSAALQRNIKALVDLFLGEPGLSRLTILVTQIEPKGVNPDMVAKSICSQGSLQTAFGRARAGGARIAVARSIQDFSEAVRAYDSKTSITLPIHQYDHHSLSTLAPRLDGVLDCYNLGQKSMQNQISSLQTKLQEIQSNLKGANNDTAYYQAECIRLTQLCVDQQTSKEAVDRQLRQIEQEYASLRSQYQLQNHIEQKDVVQGLTDLNFKIRRLSQALSTYLIDHYVQRAFGKDPADVTTLDAYDLTQLTLWFRTQIDGHSQHSSLVSSRAGVGRDVDSFFDFALCTSLCNLLIKDIFQPFYPPISQSQYAPDCDKLTATYREVQKQEPQYMAGKWRSITFKTIYEPTHSDVVEKSITVLTEKILRDCLNPLITYFFGRRLENVVLPPQYFDHCRQMVKMAWGWNSRLKGEVIMLGDFEQTAYEHCSRFDPTTMEESEPNPGSAQPECILGTLGLGLISWQAVGGGRLPEKTVVCKAVVITDSFYD